MGDHFKLLLLMFSCLFFIMNSSLAQLEINEVMYDPGQCSDDYCEWIELYNAGNESINLSGWMLCDDFLLEGYIFHDSNNLYLNTTMILQPNHYVIITDGGSGTEVYENFLIDSSVIHLHIDDATMCDSRGLSNSGGSVILTNGTSVIDHLNYSFYTNLADNNNKTLEKNREGIWAESLVMGGTPGEINSVYNYSYEDAAKDYSQLEITEFMPDPFENDDSAKPLGEWVELHNKGDEIISLEGLVLYDNYDEHELKITSVNVNSLELCSGCYMVVYRDGDSDFELNNNLEDEVRLYDGYPAAESVLIDKVSFADAVEGMGWSKFAEGWFKTNPTPARENVYTAGCDWELQLGMGNSIFQGSDLEFNITVRRNYGIAENLTVTGKIEDLFGEEITRYAPWTNTIMTTERSKSYTPNLREGIYQLHFQLEGLNCADQNWGNNQVVKLVAINPQYQKNISSLEIEALYLGNDNEVEWGDQFEAKLHIYKGKESRYSVQLWTEKGGEKVSKTTSFNIYDEYKDYTLTLPVQLIPNCNQEVSDGTIILVLEAFGLRSEKELEVAEVDEGVCKDYLDYIEKIEEDEEKEIKENSFEIVELPGSVSPGEAFRLKIQLVGDAKDHDYKVWGYLYRGNKCYSCLNENQEREHNMQKIKLRKNEVKLIELLVKVDSDIGEGEYKLKVKLNKDEQKTDKELTETIYVESKEEAFSQKKGIEAVSLAAVPDEETDYGLSAEKKKIVDSLTGLVIYESSTQKAKNLIPYVLIVSMILLIVSVLLKK